MRSGEDLTRVAVKVWDDLAVAPEERKFAGGIVRTVAASQPALDEELTAVTDNWRLERMTRVDRNVLRLGAWELGQKRDVPRAVVLDEAVELAKRFGSEESGPFVNGVLDRVADELGRVDPAEPEPPPDG